ncbi:MAG: radical SAM protein [Candidatus Thermoplasmatota archaeon]|nr:radical SAM protein [Candidatus Thermoplasmatota archaeon]
MELMVNEIFVSFQGEGVHTGIPTVFVRLAGCNLRCRWCDTEYALDPSSGIRMSMHDILTEVERYHVGMVCLTGGEPLMQEGCVELVKCLISRNILVDIETNGSLDIGALIENGEHVLISMDAKTPSSGMQERIFGSNIAMLRPWDQLKFIVKDEPDIRYAAGIIREFGPVCNIIFTPEGNQDTEKIAGLILEMVLSNELPKCARLMLQMHKMIWGPDRRRS